MSLKALRRVVGFHFVCFFTCGSDDFLAPYVSDQKRPLYTEERSKEKVIKLFFCLGWGAESAA